MRSGGVIVLTARLSLAIGVSLIVLAGCAWLLRISEFDQGRAMIMRRLRRATR
jgi:hypothetical protein